MSERKTASPINIDNGFEKIEKNELKRIEITELPKDVPNFKNTFESKDSVIKKWLTDWITSGIKKGKLKENALLPKKADLAYYLGVSVGTVQNAIRFVEDSGLLESKQRIGTIIRNGSDVSNPIIRKAASKREKVISQIKKYIIDNELKVNQSLPSARALSSIIGNSTNTTRLALDFLASQGVIETRAFRSNESNWILKKIPVFTDIDKENTKSNEINSKTLVEQVEKDLKDYIKANYSVGDKLPPHFELSEILKVSVKTVHDALKSLIDEGVLLARRGRYGTTIIKMPDSNILQPTNEVSILASNIFAKAEDAAFYSYQKIENLIKNYIAQNYEIGDKLPSMEALSERFDVSSNTIRKALQNLSKQGYVNFQRGRYGGTFVSDIPEQEGNEAFRWLAVSPQYKIV